MNVPGSIRDNQGSLLSRGGAAATLRSIDWHKHHLCRWLVAALCFASSCAHAQNSVTLAWDRNTETNIAGYRLYYGTVSRVYANVVNAGNAATASVANLVPGVTYRFAVTAFNTLGVESDYSAEIAFTTTNIVTPNIPPTIANIADRTIDQNTATGPIGFVIGDAETAASSLVLSAGSSNPTLVPIQNIVFGGSGSSRTVNVTPATDQTGTATINITVSDGVHTASDSWMLTVRSTATTNTPPALSAVRSTTIFSGGSSLPLRFSASDAQTPTEALQVWTVSSNPSLIPAGNITFQGSGPNRTLTVRAANAVGSATITLSVNDGSGNTRSTNFGVSVLARPAQLVYLPFEAEDGSIVAPMQLYTDASATYVATTSTDQGTVSLQFSITEPGNYIIWARHLSPNNARDSFFVSVDGVEIPYATAIGTWSPDWQWTRVTVPDSARTQDPRVLSLSAGTHIVTFRGSEANCGLDRIIICNDLEFVPGVAGNTAPAISSFSARTIDEDTSTGPIAFTVSDAETPGSLVINTASSNPSLVPSANMTIGGSGASRTLTVTPAPNQSGTATITVSVSDGQLSASSSFVLTVNAVNDSPTIASLPAATVPLNIPTVLQSVVIGDVDTSASSLVVTGTSSDTTVLPNANIVLGTLGLSRTLSVLPLQPGTATVTVRVSDGLAQSAQSFLLTVTNVLTPNIPPTLAGLASLTINEDAGAQTVLLAGISSGGENQTLTVTASATPQSLIPSIETVYVSPRTTGTVSFVTAPNAWGTGVVNVTVSDGLAQTVRSFTVTVNPANDAPTLTSIANSTTVEDTATPPIAFTIGDVETTAASLTLSGTSSNPTLVPNGNVVFGGSGASRTVRVTPAANQFGTASINVSVSDGSLSATRTFQLTVASSNDPPTVASIANTTTVEDTATPAVSFTIGDVETAATGLTVSGTSSSLALVPNGNIVFGGSGANRTVRVSPAANQFGTASINVLVSDGAMSSIRTFQVTVVSSNDPPTMATLVPATAVPGTLTALQPVVISDIDTAASSLVVTGTSSDTNVLPNANIVLGTPGPSRTLSVRPLTTGAATVTLRVSDGVAQSTQSFLLTVTNSTGQFALRSSFNATSGGYTLSWDSRIGYLYRVLTKTSLTQTSWIPLSNIRATNTTTSWTDLTAGQKGLGVYQIEMSAPIGFEN